MKEASKPFIRKIIYLVIMAVLLLPLNMLARPTGQGTETGGTLAKLREDYQLSQSSISEIDPASQAMKLASLGLRGVAVNILWLQAQEHKKNEDYDKMAQTLQMLTKIQPNFIKVWEYQGHNLAFNVSMEFDDYEYRYEWVKKGISFLKEGIPYNKTDHRITDNLGFFTGTKFGKSDEKFSFRRLFRKDEGFHEDLSQYVAPESYNKNVYGPDSYALAWEWYDLSKTTKEQYGRYRSDLMFGMFRPSQTRQQADMLSQEFRPDEVTQEIWGKAGVEWKEYGNSEIRTSTGVIFTLEKLAQYEKRLADLRLELDEIVPGARQKAIADAWYQQGNDPETSVILDVPLDELDDAQQNRVTAFYNFINSPSRDFDLRTVASAASEEKSLEAKRIANKIRQVLQQITAISRDGGVVNYSFWKSRCAAESADTLVRARQAMFDAKEMKKKSIYQDEYVLDFRSGEKILQRKGADSLFIEAFERWNEVLEEHPEMLDSPLADDLFDDVKAYLEMIRISNRDYPEDFPLQKFIDSQSKTGDLDGLPTSEDLAANRQDAEDEEELKSEEEDDSESSEELKEAEMEKAEMEKAEMKKAEMEKADLDKAEDKAQQETDGDQQP